MRRLVTCFFACLLCMAAKAQKPKNEMRDNLRLSASNFLVYPGPGSKVQTPAPKGLQPFYISHYGRHGSRYMSSPQEYDYAYDALRKAGEQDKLTALGQDVLERLAFIRSEGSGRYGELTPLGVEQTRAIARRMMERFPEVFEDDATIEAHSTIVTRTVLSMTNALLQMAAINPKLRISCEANFSDQYLFYIDRELTDKVRNIESVGPYAEFCRRHECWKRAMTALFNDTTYLSHAVSGERLNYYLFRMASSLQNHEARKQVTLYDLFTDEEIYENWLTQNAFWFLGYGFTPLNGNKQPYSQRYLLRQIIADADSCIQHPHPGATLRFGHDTALLPLVCLMDINGYGQSISDLEQLVKKGWVDYRVFPMAANLQLVFYRKAPDDTDVLVKVLLNEQEATLPLPDSQAPYYRWADFRTHYLELLDAYKQKKP